MDYATGKPNSPFTVLGRNVRKAWQIREVEWPTLTLILITYVVLIGALFLPVWVAVPVLAVAIAQHASLQHEAIHGHPFKAQWMNTALMWPPLMVMVPYLRFYDTHLAHHRDARLTDPLDDPESNFLDQADWDVLPRWLQTMFNANNTLLGRMILGPLIGHVVFISSDIRAIMDADRRVLWGWAVHVPALALVLWGVWLSPLPIWAFLLAAYGGMALLKIRTFAEHQAHVQAGGRSVIIEDRGPLALLFLNNNLHIVHHMHPNLPWYALPAKFRAGRDLYLRRNGNYHFRSYAEIFARYALRRKDPVAHPLWKRAE
ncbi:fatty acid desaturase [Shimia ponticola]|uniref:fatty acid desaturase n=1 Tax=Shimia ponticola TaxID=2582893 RepID=UPI0011BEE7C2|nr:fatty acid desaturase [Shimia ponticola]